MADDLQQLRVAFEDADALRTELEGNLRLGGAFAPGETSLAELARCELVLVHPETKRELSLLAEVVFVQRDGASPGTGLQLLGFDDEVLERVESFATESAPPAPKTPERGAKPPARNVQERVRGLNTTERLKLARSGNYAERLALERAFGKDVWEALLQNPRLTHPEVARIARMGTLPGPQVEAIATNPAWLTSAPVRRALLSNPRLSGPLIERVLRAFPRSELTQIHKQTTFPTAVRNAARKLCGG